MDPRLKKTGEKRAAKTHAERLRHWDVPGSSNVEQDALRLAAIVENSDDAIVSKDLDGVVTSWNRGAERIFGYTAEEMIGRPITTIIPPDLLDDEPMILAKIRAGDRIQHFQTVRLHKSGRRLDISVSISPIRDRAGNIVGASKIARDVTEQKQTQRAAHLLSAIVASSDDAIVSKDLNGVITSWNQSAERIFGYSGEEAIGKPITIIIPAEFQKDEAMILGKIKAGERVEHFETVRLRKDGERIHVALTVSPIKDLQGRIVGAAKIARDITQQKEMEAALRVSERLASVGRLAATVAHEINNPLEAVINFIYLAKSSPELSDKVQRYLHYADQELGRVAHIAQQTLGFYRDGSQAISVAIENLVKDVLTIYERKLKYKRLAIDCQIEPGICLYIAQGELKQVLSNLLVNAIDACREDGRITIRARSVRHLRGGNPGIRVTIADNGTGIPRKDRLKIFQPFFTTKKEVGTGLGLWITRDLLRKRGGNIRFRSRDVSPTGTAMSAYIPADGEEADPAAPKLRAVS